jgi:alanine racemase
MKTVTALIDLKALENNIRLIKGMLNTNVQLIGVIKANAYGHSAKRCAKVLDKYVSTFAVARIEEALELRQLGCTKDILLLGGFFSEDDLPIIESNDLSFAIHSQWMLDMIEKYKPNKKLKAWCQVNIGMERLGFNENEVDEIYQKMSTSIFLEQPINMLSHLSCADLKANDEITQKQLQLWKRITANCKGKLSLSNSACILNYKEYISDFVRPGIIQYGISPADDGIAKEIGLKPVMTFVSKIIKIRTLNEGDVVGYGASWTSKKQTQIAIVAAGYADGYPRALPNGTKVFINGNIYHTVGHVCMDMFFVDIGLNHNVNVGDEVELWGNNISVEYVAKQVNTIGYELLTSLSNRVEYKFIE